MRAIIGTIWAGVALSAIAHSAAFAQDREPRPEIFTRLVDCRSITDATARLACYDAQVAALDTAEKAREVVIVNRTQVREARRGLFGLTLPRLALFDSGDEDADEFTKIETTIKSVREDPRGRLIIMLEDGARWVQTDSRELPARARAGQKIRIRQAAMGSYLANINDQIAIRVRREN